MSAMLRDPRFACFYQGVPTEELLRLSDFRTRYPYQHARVDGQTWRYLDTAWGEKALLILAGGTTVAEVSFSTIEHLARRHRVIAPDYAPVATIGELCRSLEAMLERLGIDRFSLMGGSYGGWMAQSVLRALPERIQKVVLSASGPPNPENSRQLARMLWLLRLMPTAALRALMNRSSSRLAGEGKSEPERMLMVAHLKEVLQTQVGRRDILSALRRLIDQTEHYSFSPEDLRGWPGQMLILMGSDDPSTPPETRRAMAALYPRAKHVVLEGADHAMALTHREAYYQAIDDFLAA